MNPVLAAAAAAAAALLLVPPYWSTVFLYYTSVYPFLWIIDYSMPVSIDAQGVNTIVTAMDKISNSLTRELGPAIRDGLDLFKREAQGNAHVITGNMRDSTQITASSNSAGTVTAQAEYSGIEEYGNSRRPGHPWFFPAAESTKAQIKDIIARAIFP